MKKDRVLQLASRNAESQTGEVNLDCGKAEFRDPGDLVGATSVHNLEFDQQISVCSAHHYIRHDGTKPMFQDRLVEPIKPAWVKGRPLTIAE
ncbi:hypothetical protein ACRAWG_30920 [Methylobacterium sp. P31]